MCLQLLVLILFLIWFVIRGNTRLLYSWTRNTVTLGVAFLCAFSLFSFIIIIIVTFWGGILLICLFLLGGRTWFKEKHDNGYDSGIFQAFSERPL